MKLGTLAQHAPGYEVASDLLIFAQGLSYGLSKYFSFHLFLSLFILHRFSTFQSCSLPSSQERSPDK